MNKILTLLFLIFPVVGNSQTTGYLPLEIGNKWYFDDASYAGIEVIGDTIIAGRTYKRLSSRLIYTSSNFYLRADSTKVYRFEPSQASDVLLYDFSAVPGDTLHSDSTGGFRACDQNQMVQYVGRNLRQWDFAYGGNCVDCQLGETLVDSIGWRECWAAWYTYRLSKAVLAGKTIITAVLKPVNNPPSTFDASVYPNPFNSSALIKYSLPRPGTVKIVLFNALGQLVKVLLEAYSFPGETTLALDGNGLSSGVYYCRVSFEDLETVKKVMLVK